MKPTGFFIQRIKIIGEGVEPAEISFLTGLNVVAGASDTGKSYLFQCINYMLGGEDIPKEIPESKKYSEILFEIRTYDDKPITLKRNLRGGYPILYECGIDEISDTTSHKEFKKIQKESSDETTSSFLLNLIGLKDKKIKKNEKNQTQKLSFRDLCRFILVDEEKIITKESPVLGAEIIFKTSNKSTFDLLLSGKDSSSLVYVEDGKTLKQKLLAQIEVVERLILTINENQIKNITKVELENQSTLIQKSINDVNYSMDSIGKNIDDSLAKREMAWNTAEEASSRVIVINELLARFGLLHEHYKTDIKRLEFIAEAESLFSQLRETQCPLCGSRVHAQQVHAIDNKDKPLIVDYQEGCRREASKIRVYLKDLEATTSTMEKEKGL